MGKPFRVPHIDYPGYYREPGGMEPAVPFCAGCHSAYGTGHPEHCLIKPLLTHSDATQTKPVAPRPTARTGPTARSESLNDPPSKCWLCAGPVAEFREDKGWTTLHTNEACLLSGSHDPEDWAQLQEQIRCNLWLAWNDGCGTGIVRSNAADMECFDDLPTNPFEK